MIPSVKQFGPNFSASQINIVAISDNHGNVHSVPQMTETIKKHKHDIFVKADEKSTLNIFALVGDWFINPGKQGYFTKPKATSGDFQHDFLNKTIKFVNEQAGKDANFETVFTMGNHELDAGDKFIYKVLKRSPMKVLTTNVDMENSPELMKLVEAYSDKIVKSQVFEVQDDKNSDLKNKVLFMGITIPSMQFYNPGLLKGLKFLDDCNKKDTNLTEADLQLTIKAVKDEVEKFKQENPKGVVILSSHTGAPISKIISKNVPEINLILNGHDHKNVTTIKGNTIISSLGKDNQMIKSLNLKFDDDGNLESIDTNSYFPKTFKKEELSKNPLQKLMDQSFSEDLEPIITIKTMSGKTEDLEYSESVRFKNSYLANYLTTAVKNSLAEKYGNEGIIVGIQSSSIRGGLKDGSNNLDVVKIFSGLSEDLSNIYTGYVSGEELLGLITENVKDNLISPKRNTIMQWSDIQVNRTLIEDILNGKSDKKIKDAIKVRNESGNDFVPVDKNKKYQIALSKKFLLKDDIEWANKIRNEFISLNTTFHKLFKSYIKSNDYNLIVDKKIKEQRII